MAASRVAWLLAGWLVTLVVISAFVGCVQYGWSWLAVIAVLLVGNTFAFALFGGFLWVCWAAIR
jgi:hypothetical protein